MSTDRSVRQDRNKRIISLPEVKQLLEKLNPETSDQIQKRTLEYTTKFSKISPDAAKVAKSKLVKECGLTDEEAVELINVMPRTIEELRTFYAGWKKLIRSDVASTILQILKEHSEK